MDFARRSDVMPPANFQRRSIRTDSIGDHGGLQFRHQPVASSSHYNSNDDGALNLDSVFVSTPNPNFQQVGMSTLPHPQNRQNIDTQHSSYGSFNSDRMYFPREHQNNSEEYYDPMYPTVSTPTGESSWNPQFNTANSYRNKNDGYNSSIPPSGYALSTDTSFHSQNVSLGQQRHSELQEVHQKGGEIRTNQLRLVQNSHIQPGSSLGRQDWLPFPRNSLAEGGPLRLGGSSSVENEQKTHGIPNSELNAIGLSLNTGVIKMSSQREVVQKKNYLSLATENVGNSIFAKNTSLILDACSTSSDASRQFRSGIDYLESMNSSSIVTPNEGRSRIWVFTDFVTFICDEYGFVGPDVFFQTGVVKGDRPRLGDEVLVEAESVEGMQFKWNAKKMQVVGKNNQQDFSSNSNIAAKKRTLSPSQYFSDVLSEKISSVRRLETTGEDIFIVNNDLQKSLSSSRNPPPPPNISKPKTRAYSDSRSRRPRSRSSSYERSKYRRQSRERRNSSSRNIRRSRRSRSRSRTPVNYKRTDRKEPSPEKYLQPSMANVGNKLSFEELVFPDHRKQKSPPTKRTFIPSNVKTSDVFKTMTISKKVTPSINILPLSSASSSLLKKPTGSLPIFKAVEKKSNGSYPISSTSTNAIRSNQKLSSLNTVGGGKVGSKKFTNENRHFVPSILSAKTNKKPISEQKTNLMETTTEGQRRRALNGTTISSKPASANLEKGRRVDQPKVLLQENSQTSGNLLNPVYKCNARSDKLVAQKTMQPVNTKQTDYAPDTASSAKPISIRLGYIEMKKQQKEQKLTNTNVTNISEVTPVLKSLGVVGPCSLPTTHAEVEKNNLNYVKVVDVNTEKFRIRNNKTAEAPHTSTIKCTVTEEKLRVWEEERRSRAKLQNSRTVKEMSSSQTLDKSKNTNMHNQKQQIVELNPVQKSSNTKKKGIEVNSKEIVKTNSRGKPVKELRREGVRKNLSEVRMKSRMGYRYRERLRRIENKTETNQRRLQMRRDRAPSNSRNKLRHQRKKHSPSPLRPEPATLIQIERRENYSPIFAIENPDLEASEFLSEEQIALRERELEIQEQQLDEEQYHLNAKMAELDAQKLGSPQDNFREGRSRSHSPEFYGGDRLHSGHSSPKFSSRSRSGYQGLEQKCRPGPRSPYSIIEHGNNLSRSRSPGVRRRHLSHIRQRSGSNSAIGSVSHLRGRPSGTPSHPKLQRHRISPSSRTPRNRFSRDMSPFARFRIDRRSPGRITPEDLTAQNDNDRYHGPRGNSKRMHLSGGSDVYTVEPSTDFGYVHEYRNEPFTQGLDFELSINERRCQADDELMNEELGEEERLIFTGITPLEIPLIFQNSDQLGNILGSTSQRIVWSPEDNLGKNAAGFRIRCNVCGKRGHNESVCWHRPSNF